VSSPTTRAIRQTALGIGRHDASEGVGLMSVLNDGTVREQSRQGCDRCQIDLGPFGIRYQSPN
jgi:hypothetical protein